MKQWNKEIAKEINPQIAVKITKEDVSDILSSAFEGGIGYWATVSADDNDYSEAKKHLVEQGEDPKNICFEEVFTQILFDGESLEVYDIEDDKKRFLSLERLFIGLQKAIEDSYYSHYNWYVPEEDGSGKWQLDCGQVDSAVADIIVQLSLFGEVVYG